jgi:outer membrane protein OmpA-like peptidoglycan-associated protein
MNQRLFVALVVLVLGGCASTPPVGTTPPAVSPRDIAALATERQWLQSWFKDTPVRIEQRGDGPVSIEVPREFSFEAGRSNVKPALGALLDKVAESLRRTPRVRLALIAAPGDSASAAPLALRRATQVRTHLVDRGVPAVQLGDPEAAAGDAVQLRLAVGPP